MKKLILMLVSGVLILSASGQGFEESVSTDEIPEKPKVSVGADFAMQFQSLKHQAEVDLIPLGSNINLPTANFVIKALLAEGIEVNLETYLSSRHHVEAWVKGGYLLIDRLPFIKSKFTDRLMDFMTFKAGVMEINYGDAHFRRSDNGNVINNPFVGNYILDAFTTAPAFEALFRSNGILVMGAISTGTLRPTLVGYSAGTQTYTPYNAHEELAFYWKAGYDNQITDQFRLRATLSGYHAANHHFGSLHNGDRAGSRYYLVMNRITNSPDDVKSGKPGDAGYIDITVESNVNRIFFKYNISEWCLSFPGASRTSYDDDTSVSLIRVPVKDFKSTSLFVYRDFLALLKADEFPYLEIGVPQSPGNVYHSDGSYILKGVSVTVAGVTNKYDILCHIEKDDYESRLLSGTLKIKLTDLDIDPPVKLSGLVKVRNEIIVKFGFCIRNTVIVTT